MRPVHTYIELVQCPVCRYTFMTVGDECCWRCAPQGAPPAYGELAVARLERQRSEMADGSLGSLAGLGFAPIEMAPAVFGETPPAIAQAPAEVQITAGQRQHAVDNWRVARWAVIIGWILFMAHAVQCLLQHRPFIGP